jgi:O-methyltransferase
MRIVRLLSNEKHMSHAPPALSDLYLDLLKRTLVRWDEDEMVPLKSSGPPRKAFLKKAIIKRLASRSLCICKHLKSDADKRIHSRDWPARATTMIGIKRLENIRYCVECHTRENPRRPCGDGRVAGWWQHPMRAVLEANGDPSRLVRCADSFVGLPAPDVKKYPQGKEATWHLSPELAISLKRCRAIVEFAF